MLNSDGNSPTMATSTDKKENDYMQGSRMSVASSSLSLSTLKSLKSNPLRTNILVEETLTSGTLSMPIHQLENLCAADHQPDTNCQSKQNNTNNENWMDNVLLNIFCPSTNEGTVSFEEHVDSNLGMKDCCGTTIRDTLCRKRKFLEETINNVKKRNQLCGAKNAARPPGQSNELSKDESVNSDIGHDNLNDSEGSVSGDHFNDEWQAQSNKQVDEKGERHEKEDNDQKIPQVPWIEPEAFGMRQQSSYASQLQAFLQNMAMSQNTTQMSDGILNIIQNEFLLEKLNKECIMTDDGWPIGIFPETNEKVVMTGQKTVQLQEEDAVQECPKCTLTFSSNLFLEFHLKICHGDDDDDEATQEQRNLLTIDFLKQFAKVNAVALKYYSGKEMDGDLRNLDSGNHKDDEDIRHNRYFDTRKLPWRFPCRRFYERGENLHHNSFCTQDMQKHPTHKPFSCDECDKTFLWRNSLLVHMRTHTGERPFKCEECDKSYGQNSLLRRHMRIHTGERPFECDKCRKTYVRSSHLHIHMRQHTGEKPFSCDECGKSFSQSCLLQRHTRTHTGEKPFECEECGKSFTRKHILQAHMRSHTGERPFKCDECGKRFSRTNGLQMHMKTHSEVKPHKCEECGKCFKWINDLRLHRRSHTGEKPFKCEECGKNFSRKSSLHVHNRMHTGEKPYKCNECGKSFIQSGELHTHRRTHTGEKPFKCDECGRCFSQSSHLHMHKRQHTGEKPFQCGECGRSFSRNSLLLSHMRTHTKKLGLSL